MSMSMITKSIRLAGTEAEELTNVANQTSASEAALMKKWILEGIQTYKLERAIKSYMERETDLRGGAAMAGIPYNHFLRQVQKHHIIILEDDRFLDRLGDLADAFDSEPLRQALDQIISTPV